MAIVVQLDVLSTGEREVLALMAEGPSVTGDDQRRVLAVIRYLDAR